MSVLILRAVKEPIPFLGSLIIEVEGTIIVTGVPGSTSSIISIITLFCCLSHRASPNAGGSLVVVSQDTSNPENPSSPLSSNSKTIS